jgi:hypothetical protein
MNAQDTYQNGSLNLTSCTLGAWSPVILPRVSASRRNRGRKEGRRSTFGDWWLSRAVGWTATSR